MALQQMRVVHLAMMGVVGVSLFIYASYMLMSVSSGVDIQQSHSLITPPEIHIARLESDRLKYGLESTNTSMEPLFVTISGGTIQKVLTRPAAETETASKIQAVTNEKSKKVVDAKPGEVVSAKSTSGKSNVTYGAPALDLTRGILAKNLYEPGHPEAMAEICPNHGESITLLILIMSAPNNKEARMAIRQTWGHFKMRTDVALGFLLGQTQSTTVEESLGAESNMYKDIIRGHFIDSYNNLTLKTISMLEWTDNYCPKGKFVLKTDDDMFINVPKLLGFINKHYKYTRTIFGRLAKKWKPIRNKKSKYYVAPQQYLPSVFPDFTTGPAYLITSDIIHEMYLSALEHTYLKLEDVFTTGIVAHAVGVKLIHIREFLNKRISFNPCNIQKAISIHMIKTSEQFDLWKKLLDGKSKCK